ncbi:MAG: hydrogenase expression/formation protein HypE [Nitrospirales bacterium]
MPPTIVTAIRKQITGKSMDIHDLPEWSCPLPSSSPDTIRLAHGGGGQLMQDLLREIFLPAFSNPFLESMQDSAVLPTPKGRLAFTTDAYVVQPLFFPGGDIGSLSIHGTVNDLAMQGATPLYLSASFILEEGLPIETLKRVVTSMARTAKACGVRIVCGDTKVVDHGKGDQVFITTTGVGVVPEELELGPHRILAGDRIVVSGDLGAHGIAVLSTRQGLEFSGNLRSDSAPLHEVVASLIQGGITCHCLRDLTRGGLASALNELATASRSAISLEESCIPVSEPVRGACEILGLDPLYVANEGRFVLILPDDQVKTALPILKAHTVSQYAAEIGRVLRLREDRSPQVVLKTPFHTERILDLLSGEQLPRIC